MTDGDRRETAPASEVSWVKKALFVVVDVVVFFLHITYQEWRKSLTELYFFIFCIS